MRLPGMSLPLDSDFVRQQINLRGLRLNDQPVYRGEYVLYWMQSTHRFEENWALRYATLKADQLGVPLFIHQGLDPTYEHANDRIHTFILRNAAELSGRASTLGLQYHFALRRRRDDDRRVVDRLAANAALVVTDLFPTAGIAERTRRFAQRCPRRVVAVESHAIVPSGVFEKEEYAARTIRPKLLAALSHALQVVEDRPPRCTTQVDADHETLDFSTVDVASEVARCEIDHAVPPVATASGLTAARARLFAFCRDTLPSYAKRRVDPTDDLGSSRLSPYLHFGQISPAEVVRSAQAAGPAPQVETFVNEMVVWRELSLNFCLRNRHFGSLRALPEWVHKTMREHASDPREAEYDLQTFEAGRTHDDLWNAAQLELVTSGAMHNVVRMLWGKHIISWAPTYEQALDWMIYLNNKYALDGRDPSSYAGIQWCFGKFDRPFYGRPVLGLIRPMSLKRAREKWDVDSYVARWLPRTDSARS